MTLDTRVKITAHIPQARPDTCRFTVDRPVHETGSAYFWKGGPSAASPLAGKLLALDGALGVRIAGHDVVIRRDSAEEWKPFAAKVGEILREQLGSGEPAVAADFRPDPKEEARLKNQVQMLFETRVNPSVASHGGHVDLMDVKDHRIYLRMGGGCHGCGMASVTLRQGIEGLVREELPEIDEIVDATDHASGASPYYPSQGE